MTTRNLLDESRERAAAARAASEAARSAAADAERLVAQARGGAALMRREHEGRAGETPEQALARGADADRLEREALALQPRATALQTEADRARRDADRAAGELDARIRRVVAVVLDALPAAEATLSEARQRLAEAEAAHGQARHHRDALAAELDSLGEPVWHELRRVLDDGVQADVADTALRVRREVRADAA